LVAGDVAFERLERIGPELREAVQLELHEYARRRGARGEREPLQHEAGRPAVGPVFESPDAFDDPAVGQRVVEPPDPIPAAEERPLRGEVYLFSRARLRDVPAQVAITQ